MCYVILKLNQNQDVIFKLGGKLIFYTNVNMLRMRLDCGRTSNYMLRNFMNTKLGLIYYEQNQFCDFLKREDFLHFSHFQGTI